MIRFPRCVGKYEVRNNVCNGNVVGKTEEERASCAYRDRCAGFVKYLREVRKSPSDFVTVKRFKDEDGEYRIYAFAKDDPKELVDLMTKQIMRYEITKGRPRLSHPKEIKPARNVKKKKRKTYKSVRPKRPKTPEERVAVARRSRSRKIERKKSIVRNLEWFVVQLSRALKKEVRSRKGSCDFGDFWIESNFEASVDIAKRRFYLLQKLPDGSTSKVVKICANYGRKIPTLFGYLCVGSDELSSMAVSGLGIQDYDSSMWPSKMKGPLKTEEISILASEVAKLYRKKFIICEGNGVSSLTGGT